MTLRLTSITLAGFKSFGKKTVIACSQDIVGIVGPNGSGKSNVSEAIRFVLGEGATKLLRATDSSDLLFKGSRTIPAAHTALVTLTFRGDGFVPLGVSAQVSPFLGHEEISVSRELSRDGTSVYSINTVQVRLKDVEELLMSSGVGGHVYTIISQGDSDRLLRISSQERAKVVEEALSLGVYRIRLKESSKKLAQAALLKNKLTDEIRVRTPQVKELKLAVERASMRDAVRDSYVHTLTSLSEVIYQEMRTLEKTLREATQEHTHDKLSKLTEELTAIRNEHQEPSDSLVKAARKQFHDARSAYDDVVRQIDRLEGRREAVLGMPDVITIPEAKTYETLQKTIAQIIELLTDSGVTDQELRTRITKILSSVSQDAHAKSNVETSSANSEKDAQVAEIGARLTELLTQKKVREEAKNTSYKSLTEEEELYREKSHTVRNRSSHIERLEAQLTILAHELTRIDTMTHAHGALSDQHAKIIREIAAFPAPSTLNEDVSKDRATLERDLVKLSSKLEMLEDIDVHEKRAQLTDHTARLTLITTELAACESSIRELEMISITLYAEGRKAFEEGLTSINTTFTQFFSQVVPGGVASLTYQLVTQEEGEDAVPSIDISVLMPGKKASSLQLLSGGEKTLVSMALLFAMASVSAPPFMVLDETDAPLDEKNAAKYGAMLRSLASRSQLLLVTHNRETMKYCDVLYGVTMGLAGYSSVLSVSLDEAKQSST